MKELTRRESPFPSEIIESQRLMKLREDAYYHNKLDAFFSLLGSYLNGEGWRATVEFHPDHPPSKKTKDGKSYFKLDLNRDGIHLAILSDLTFAEIHSIDDVRSIDKSIAIDMYTEKELIWIIGERMRRAITEANRIYGPVDLPPLDRKIPEHLTPVGGK